LACSRTLRTPLTGGFPGPPTQVLGKVGTWNIFLLIASLINGLVMLNAANVIVMIIACYLMGLKSPFFKSAVIEDVNFREQYARYAAHVIAHHQSLALLPPAAAVWS
jgi:hypothetical protein